MWTGKKVREKEGGLLAAKELTSLSGVTVQADGLCTTSGQTQPDQPPYHNLLTSTSSSP